MWILFAFLTPALFAASELLDGYLSNKKFKSVISLVFFASITNLLFVPIVFSIESPNFSNSRLILPLIGVGLTNVLYLYPYYKALQIEDTSVVAAFFSIGKIITPILAFLILNEELSILQYLGLGLVIMANFFLAIKYGRVKVEIKKSFLLIAAASVILAFEGILFKYMFEIGLKWSTAVGGQLIATFIIALLIFSIRRFRMQIQMEFRNFVDSFKLFFVEELITFSAIAIEAYAIKLAPLSLVKGVGLTIPLFVIFYTLILKKHRPNTFQEDIQRRILLKRIPLYFILILGLFLLGFPEY